LELPIQIMIVLFVTVLVASAVVMFTTDIIRDAKDKMADPFGKEKSDDKIIEIDTIQDQQLSALIEQCWRDNKQEALEKTLCFVMHAQLNTATLSGLTTITTATDTIDVEANFLTTDKTVYIYYNPVGNMIQVSG